MSTFQFFYFTQQVLVSAVIFTTKLLKYMFLRNLIFFLFANFQSTLKPTLKQINFYFFLIQKCNFDIKNLELFDLNQNLGKFICFTLLFLFHLS